MISLACFMLGLALGLTTCLTSLLLDMRLSRRGKSFAQTALRLERTPATVSVPDDFKTLDERINEALGDE